MNDKLDELASEIDDAVLTTEELKSEPGAIPEKKLDNVQEALEQAQDAVDDLENAED